MFVHIKKITNYTKSQSNHFHNSLSHKICFRIAEKKIISFTIELSVIQESIVNKTLSKSQKQQYRLIMMKKKEEKNLKMK